MKLNFLKNILTINSTVLIGGILLGGFIAVLLGKEVCWDLANYHFYNPYAFLYDRQNIDYWPSTFIHQFINPTIDLLSYFLIAYTSPWLAEFTLGAIHGINLWLIFVISTQFITERFKYLIAVMLALISMSGALALPGIGSFQNDNLVSIFVLSHVLLMIKFIQVYQVKHRISKYLAVLAGLTLGIGVGLKLTAAIFVIGSVAACLFIRMSFNKKVILFSLCALGFLPGFLLSAGHWMYFLWVQHHNPFFPFFNGIFKSPDFDVINWRDLRFLPKSITEAILFPFLFSLDGRTADYPFRDFRFSVVYILFVLSAIQWLSNKFYKKTTTTHTETNWLYYFFIFSYLIWQIYFAIARYITPLEILTPLIIFLLVRQLIQSMLAQLGVLCAIFYMLFAFMLPSLTPRLPINNSYFNIKLPAFVATVPRANVLVSYPIFLEEPAPKPQSYLLPFFPKEWRFVGIPFLKSDYFFRKKTHQKIYSHLKKDNNPLFLLTPDANLPSFLLAIKKFKLVLNGRCEEIHSDRQKLMQGQKVLLCPLKSVT